MMEPDSGVSAAQDAADVAALSAFDMGVAGGELSGRFAGEPQLDPFASVSAKTLEHSTQYRKSIRKSLSASLHDADGGMAAMDGGDMHSSPLAQRQGSAKSRLPVRRSKVDGPSGSPGLGGQYSPAAGQSSSPLARQGLSGEESGAGSGSAASGAGGPAASFSWDGVKIGGAEEGLAGHGSPQPAATGATSSRRGTGPSGPSNLPKPSATARSGKGPATQRPSMASTGQSKAGGGYADNAPLSSHVGDMDGASAAGSATGANNGGPGQAELLARLAAKDRDIGEYSALLHACERLESVLIALEPVPGLNPSKLLEADRAGSSGAARGAGTGTDPRDAKVLDLAKRNRELSRALARETERASKALNEAGRWKASHAAATDREREMRDRLDRDRAGRGLGMVAEEGSDASSAAAAQASLAAGMGPGAVSSSSSQLAGQVKHAQAAMTKAVRERDRALAEVRACHRVLRAELGPQAHLGRLLAAHGITHSLVLGQDGQGQEGQTKGSGDGATTDGQEGNLEVKPGDWRGRAQVISLLRSRVKNLERELGLRQVGGQQTGQACANNGQDEVSGGPYSGQSGDGQANGFPPSQPHIPLSCGPSDAEFGLGMGEDGDWDGEGGQAQARMAAGAQHQHQLVRLPVPAAAQGSNIGPNSNNNSAAPSFDVDDRAVATLAARENLRARAVQDAQAEAAALRTERDKFKGEAAAAKARASVLDGEIKKMRGHVRSLLAKAETDDKLVGGLRGELDTARTQLEKLRKAGAAAALMGLPASALGSGLDDGSDGQATAQLKRELDEARRQLQASDRAAASLKKQLRVLRDVLEANGIDPPLDSIALPLGHGAGGGAGLGGHGGSGSPISGGGAKAGSKLRAALAGKKGEGQAVPGSGSPNGPPSGYGHSGHGGHGGAVGHSQGSPGGKAYQGQGQGQGGYQQYQQAHGQDQGGSSPSYPQQQYQYGTSITLTPPSPSSARGSPGSPASRSGSLESGRAGSAQDQGHNHMQGHMRPEDAEWQEALGQSHSARGPGQAHGFNPAPRANIPLSKPAAVYSTGATTGAGPGMGWQGQQGQQGRYPR